MPRETVYDVTSRLHTWRTNTLNKLLNTVAIVGLPVLALFIFEEARRPEEWKDALVIVFLYLLVVGLAIFRRLGLRLRAWSLLMLGYVAGVQGLARGGLAGDGRIYFLALPVLALILIGPRSGLAMTIFSLILFAAFTMFVHMGWMTKDWLVTKDNSLLLINWVVGGASFALLLIIIVTIQWHFGQLQETIALENARLYKESEMLRAFNENIVQSMDEGVIIDNTTGHMTFVNPKAAELLDDSPENLIGQHWKTFVAPEQIAKVQEEVEKQHQGATSLYETVLQTRGKKHVPVIVSARPLFESGHFTGVLIVLTDVTALRQTEETLRQRTTQLEALRQVGLELTAQLDLDILLQSIVSRAMELLGGTSSGLYLYRPEQDALEWNVSLGSVATAPVGTIIHRGEGLSGKIWEIGEPLAVDDYARWAGHAAAWEDSPTSAVVGAPIHWGEEFLGVLNVGASVPHTFSPADTELLSLFATQSAIAIQNARLYEQSQHEIAERKQAEDVLLRRNRELALLHHTSQVFNSTLDLDQVLATVLEEARRLLDADACSVWLLDPTTDELICRQATEPASEIVRGWRLAPGKGLAGWVARHGESLIVPDTRSDERHFKGVDQKTKSELRSIISIPLQVKQNVIGVLQMVHVEVGHFDSNDQALLEPLAASAAIAIENARLYEQARREIVERKQAEGALRESEGKYRSFVERANDGIAIVQDTIVKYANPRLVEMWSDTGEKITGIPFTNYVHPDELGKVINRYKQRIAGDSTASVYETILRRKNGSEVHVELNAGLIAYEEKPADLMIIRDITERKQMEKQLRQHAQLSAIGQLSSGIAHDFNNFLTIIILHAQTLMSKRDVPSDMMQDFEIILNESQRAANLVQQILDFGRRSMMETRPVDLVFLAREVNNVLQRTIQENIHLILDAQNAEPGKYVVETEPTCIHQILLNLATNARDAMLEGGDLRIELAHVEVKPGKKPPLVGMDAGKWVHLAVSDTGAGIPPDVLPHIFEPFFTTKKPGKGTGLGLAQVYGIIRQHKGHIGVETVVGEGTTFRIYLPAYIKKEKMEKVKAEEPSAILPGRGETILVVEDEAGLRASIEEVLESLDYRVLTAKNGREALEVYRSAVEVDLVLADLVMPEMGGKQLIRELKQENPDLKALAITGYVMDVDLEETKEAGFLGVASKPFDMNRLAKMIRSALDAE